MLQRRMILISSCTILKVFYNVSDISSTVEASSALSDVDPSDTRTLLKQMGVVWTKCVRSDFIRSNKIRFPEGRIYEEFLSTGSFVILAEKITILPERLYYYRIQPLATTNRKDWENYRQGFCT